jgi:hypothetical protein
MTKNVIVFLIILILILILINYKNNEFFVSNKKELKFIHITKNAGTSIENLGKNTEYIGEDFIKNMELI